MYSFKVTHSYFRLVLYTYPLQLTPAASMDRPLSYYSLNSIYLVTLIAFLGLHVVYCTA